MSASVSIEESKAVFRMDMALIFCNHIEVC